LSITPGDLPKTGTLYQPGKDFEFMSTGSVPVPAYVMITLLVELADFHGATSRKHQITS